MSGLRIGIVGAGVGGLAAAIALKRHGHHISVFEQAGKFARVGADINLTPNAVRALDGLGAALSAYVRNGGLLGGGSNMWSNVTFAGTFQTLVTGHPVVPRITPGSKSVSCQPMNPPDFPRIHHFVA